MPLECEDQRHEGEIPTLGYHDFSLFLKCLELVKETDVYITVCEDCFMVRTTLSRNVTVKQVTTLYGYLLGFLEGRKNEREGSKEVEVKLKTTICNMGDGSKKNKAFTKTSNSKLKMTKRQLGPWAQTSDKK